jgi:phosphoribosyl 1,2-cyclic phosphate phosphodiesterase
MSIKFTILGCGSSLGIPRIDGYYGSCDPRNKRNIRSRCSALLSSKNLNILIDTSPDLKSQLLKNKVKNIDTVFYTHSHADQTHGINELRVFSLKNKKKIPIYADANTMKDLKDTFGYCFKDYKNYPSILDAKILKKKHLLYDLKTKISIKSLNVHHGSIKSICYIINDKCAYAPDVNKIDDKDLKYLKNLKYLIVDCLRYNFHPTHFNLEDVLKLIYKIKPKNTILTNLSNEIDYNEIKKLLPKNVTPAHDGLTVLV